MRRLNCHPLGSLFVAGLQVSVWFAAVHGFSVTGIALFPRNETIVWIR